MDSSFVSGTAPAPSEGVLEPSTMLSGSSAVGLSREHVKFGCAPDQKGSNRRRRYRRRRRAGELARFVERTTGFKPSWGRIRNCGVPIGAQVSIKEHEGKCYPSGIAQCASVWSCAVCSAKIRTRREVELEVACNAHVASGGSLAMLTFTLRHNRSMSLFEVLGALLRSYRRLRNRKAWKAVRCLLVGVVRALEVTIGENGWHPHLHLLLFVRSEVERHNLESLLGEVITEWRAIVGEDLGVLPSVERAVDLTWFGNDAVSAASYVSKIAKEISLADSKSGRDPFSLLDVQDVGRDEAVALWIEYANTMRGVQSVSWTKGLRDLFNLGEYKFDEDFVQDEDQLDVVVQVVSRDEWKQLWRSGRECDLLEEIEGRLRAQKFFDCDEWGEVIVRE